MDHGCGDVVDGSHVQHGVRLVKRRATKRCTELQPRIHRVSTSAQGGRRNQAKDNARRGAPAYLHTACQVPVQVVRGVAVAALGVVADERRAEDGGRHSLCSSCGHERFSNALRRDIPGDNTATATHRGTTVT